MLFEDGRDIRFGGVVDEGGITKDDMSGARGSEHFMPFGDSVTKIGYIVEFDSFLETNEKRARSDRVNNLSRDCLLLCRKTEIESKLKNNFKKNILIGSIGFQVIDRFEEGLRDVVAFGIPFADIRRREFENAEADIA